MTGGIYAKEELEKVLKWCKENAWKCGRNDCCGIDYHEICKFIENQIKELK